MGRAVVAIRRLIVMSAVASAGGSGDVAAERRAGREEAQARHIGGEHGGRDGERQQVRGRVVCAGEQPAGEEPRDRGCEGGQRGLGDGEPSEGDGQRDDLVAYEHADRDPQRAVGGAGEDAADRRLKDGGAPWRHAGSLRVDPGQGDRRLDGDAGRGDDRAQSQVCGELGDEDAPARRRGQERRDGGAVAELPRGADGDEQEQEVAAGAEDVADAGRGVESGGRVAERQARVEGGEGEDRREEAVGHRRARRLVGFAGEESARAGGGGHAAISISVVGAVSSKNRASRSAASVVIAVRGMPASAATSPTVSAVAPATVRVSWLERVASMPRVASRPRSSPAWVVRTVTVWPARALSSSSEPWSRRRPRAMMTTSSTVCWTSDSRWLEISTVLPASA